MKRLFISTTNQIDNGKVTQYYGVVSSHIVAGTGFLSEFAASFSDFFGGRSGSYRRQLESLYDEAIDDVSNKARYLGANSILGFRIDMDEISGKGMSMFMITAVGTAAKIQFDDEKQVADISVQGSISSEMLTNAIEKQKILRILNDDKAYLTSEKWETIMKNPDNDYIIPLTERYFNGDTSASNLSIDEAQGYQKNYNDFIQIVDRNLVIKAIYGAMIKSSSFHGPARKLIRNNFLFDAKEVLSLIKKGYLDIAMSILNVEQPSYTETDLHDMEALVEAIDNLPNQGIIEFVKGGVFSKEGEKYVCQYGHKNDKDQTYCSECGRNIKGLTIDHVMEVESFKNKVHTLRELIEKQ